ncbi:TPA: hypothetical protein ACH3X1_001415 [Trebouxia sp. C0004]
MGPHTCVTVIALTLQLAVLYSHAQGIPAPGPAVTAIQTEPYQNNLNPVVVPSPATVNGSDWCKPFKPCNRTERASAESSYSLGLAPVVGAGLRP